MPNIGDTKKIPQVPRTIKVVREERKNASSRTFVVGASDGRMSRKLIPIKYV
jgi:hypothetical protein